jgi:hypothetical protein
MEKIKRQTFRTAFLLFSVLCAVATYSHFFGDIEAAFRWGKQASLPKLETNRPAILHPIERIAYSDDWRLETTRNIKRGGFVSAILRTGLDSCAAIGIANSDTKLWVMYPTEIETPSSEGGRTGTFYEALIPRNPTTCKTSRYVFAEWKSLVSEQTKISIGSDTISVNVSVQGKLATPKRPLFIATTNSYLIKGHCKSYCRREGELAKKYAEVLADHHIQPIQNWIGLPPVTDGYLDLNHRSDLGLSFRQTTMAYSSSGYVGFPRARQYTDKIAYLRALEATVHREKLVGKAWVYSVDEPDISQDLVEELKLYKLFAPSVKVMVTADYDQRLAQVIDIFAPVFNNLVAPHKPSDIDYKNKELWTYASCMGSCGPNRRSAVNTPKSPGPDTNLPDFLIDRPAERLFDFFKTLDDMKVDGALYYEATEGYPLTRAGIDLFSDPWNFGGNGDGLLLYPGRPGEFELTEHQPIASLRLKLIRHAIENYW